MQKIYKNINSHSTPPLIELRISSEFNSTPITSEYWWFLYWCSWCLLRNCRVFIFQPKRRFQSINGYVSSFSIPLKLVEFFCAVKYFERPFIWRLEWWLHIIDSDEREFTFFELWMYENVLLGMIRRRHWLDIDHLLAKRF